MLNFPVYQGKTIAYLDQNILDVFVKFGMIDFAHMLKENFQIVYSDETLNEIKRSGEYANKFLDVLNDLNACHLKQMMTDSFEPTDKATISKKDSYLAYKEYCDQLPLYQELLGSMMQTVFKIYGGRKGDNFEEINSELLGAFSNLMVHLHEQADTLNDSSPNLAYIIKDTAKTSLEHMDSVLKQSASLMSSNVNDEENWSGVRDFRNAMNIGPVELNNISPPNVLEKIWDLYKDKEEYKNLNWTVDDFFFLKADLISPGKSFFNFQKITCIYNHLNFIGYYPDSKTYKERRFTAALSDQGHASIASFTDVIFSRDENFVKKTRAAYEYLGIKTEVILVTLDLRNKP